MENPSKIAALGNVLSMPQQGAQGHAALPPPSDPDDVVDRFEALMSQRGDGRTPVGAVAEHSKLVSVVEGLTDDGLTVAEETDALYENDDGATPDEVVMRMAALSSEMRLVGLQLKAFSEVSKQSREGVQTLIRS
jgi:hypothetical protein